MYSIRLAKAKAKTMYAGMGMQHATINWIWLSCVYNYWFCKPVTEYFLSLQLHLPESDMLPRYCHSVAAIELAPGLIEVTVFGGCPQFDIRTKGLLGQAKVAETVVMSFGKFIYGCNSD